MRDGMIYFKEPTRAPMFAVPRHFAQNLAGDELVQAWQEEVVRRNYGRFYWAWVSLPARASTTVIAGIHRADYFGWVCDAFQLDWKIVPPHRNGRETDIWTSGLRRVPQRALKRHETALLDRAQPGSERQNIEPHWAVGEETELRRVFSLVLRLYARSTTGSTAPISSLFMASNPASFGGWRHTFNPSCYRGFQFSSALQPLLDVLPRHFVWTGLEWTFQEANRDSTTKANLHAREQNQKWGRDWRGNWSVTTPSIRLHTDVPSALSAHEKLESLLELRDWLDDQVSLRQRDNWLAKALD